MVVINFSVLMKQEVLGIWDGGKMADVLIRPLTSLAFQVLRAEPKRLMFHSVITPGYHFPAFPDLIQTKSLCIDLG